jgi:hypothetical protein
VEWAKAKARADRWEEEVVLLNEEMRRILEFCNRKAAWWENKIQQQESEQMDEPLADGLRAYAHQQAALEREISTKWAHKWRQTRNRAIPIISAVMGEDWVAGGDVEDIDMDDLANDLIELELDDEDGGKVVGSDCED